jgi:hypothetical protein
MSARRHRRLLLAPPFSRTVRCKSPDSPCRPRTISAGIRGASAVARSHTGRYADGATGQLDRGAAREHGPRACEPRGRDEDRYPAQIEERTIAGVPTRVFKPTDAELDEERVLIKLHGGAFPNLLGLVRLAAEDCSRGQMMQARDQPRLHDKGSARIRAEPL